MVKLNALAFDLLPLPSIVVDSDFQIVSTNRSFLKAGGYRSDDILGRPVTRVLPDFSRDINLPDNDIQTERHLTFVTSSGAQKKKKALISRIPDISEGEPAFLLVLNDPVGTICPAPERCDTERILRSIVEGSSSKVGQSFFDKMVERLAEALDVHYVFMGELAKPDNDRVRTLAVIENKSVSENLTYELEHTPCEYVISKGRIIIEDKVQNRFPKDGFLKVKGIESYLGLALKDSGGQTIGLLSIMDNKPLTEDRTCIAMPIVEIFAARAAVELERILADKRIAFTTRKLDEERRAFVDGPVVVFKWRNEHLWPAEYVSSNVASVLGYSVEEMLSGDIPYDKLIVPEDIEQAIKEMEFYSVNGVDQFQHTPYRLKTKSGKIIWVDDYTSIIRDKNGEVTQFVGYIIDITQRKEAELALWESKETFWKLCEAAFEGIVISDDGKIIEANKQALKMFGYSAEEFIDLNVIDCVSPKSKEVALNKRNTNEPSYEFFARKKDGTTFPVEASSRVIPVKGRNIRVTALRDLSESKKAAEAQQRLTRALMVLNTCNEEINSSRTEDELFQNVCSAIVKGAGYLLAWVGFAEHNIEKNIRIVASEGQDRDYIEKIKVTWSESQFGSGPAGSAIRHGKPSIFQHIADDPNFSPWRAEALKRGYQSVIGIPLIDKEETYGALLIYAADPGAFDDEEVELLRRLAANLNYGLQSIRANIERSQAEQALKRLNEELEERVQMRTLALEAANRELEAFAYSVSHDLRAPLRTIDGFSQAIQEDYASKLDETGQNYLNRIRNGSQRMGHLIDDMLKLSKLTQAVLNPELVNLSQVVEAIAGDLKSSDKERKVEFRVDPELTAIADKRLIRIALQNLLSNAWKFTAGTKKAWIQFGVIGEGEEREFFVRDNGAGFNMDYSSKLFGAFQRLHAQSEFPGAGIGLATVKRVIRRHGGFVRAEGEVAKGATFYFTLGLNSGISPENNISGESTDGDKKEIYPAG